MIIISAARPLAKSGVIFLDIVGFLRYCGIVIISNDRLKNNSMSLARKFAYNNLVQVIGKAISIILGIMSIALIARYLGVEGFGRYTALSNFLGIFAVLADLGLTMVTAQMINEQPEERQTILNNLFGFRLFTAGAIIIIGLLVAAGLPYYRELWFILAILAGSYFFIALNQILTGLLQSELKVDYLMIAEVAGRLLWLGGLVVSHYFNWGLIGIAAATTFSSFVNFGLAWLLSAKRIKIHPDYQADWWRKIAQRSWPLAITIILNLLYLRTDILFLSWWQSETAVGLYGAAYKVIDVLTSLPFLFIGLLLPLLTRVWAANDRQKFNFLVNTALLILLILVSPLIIGGQILSTPIIQLIAGASFSAAGPILAMLLVALAGIFMGCLFNHLLIAINQQQIMVRPYLLVAITAVPAYYLLIRYLSYWGAAIVTVYSELLVAILAGHKAKKIIQWRWPRMASVKLLIANLCMALAIWPCRHWAGQGIINLLITVLIGALVYSLSLIGLKVINWSKVQSIFRPND